MNISSPKLLLVKPSKRLSWQYHNRRAELWKIVSGPVGVVTSHDDHQDSPNIAGNDEFVHFDKKIRHRLCGLDDWGVVAEIWQHTDTGYPSDEADIIRVGDDFRR